MDEESDDRYVRCPACRSLIPFGATSCRMCGVELRNAGVEGLVTSKESGQASIPLREASDGRRFREMPPS